MKEVKTQNKILSTEDYQRLIEVTQNSDSIEKSDMTSIITKHILNLLDLIIKGEVKAEYISNRLDCGRVVIKRVDASFHITIDEDTYFIDNDINMINKFQATTQYLNKRIRDEFDKYIGSVIDSLRTPIVIEEMARAFKGFRRR